MIKHPWFRTLAAPFIRPLYKVHRRFKGAASYVFRMNHPVQPHLWDRAKGLVGWVASDSPLQAISVAGPDGEVSGKLLPRGDVAWLLHFQYSHHIGFSIPINLETMVLERGEAQFTVTLRFASGEVRQEVVKASFDREEQEARFARFRPLYRCPDTGEELEDVEGGLKSAGNGRLYPVRGGMVDFMPERASEDFGADETDNISSWDYDEQIIEWLKRKPDGVYLDCGAGLRADRFPNVINLEIARYSTTDILAVAEYLPLADESLDGVISIAVLEHVRDPFRCAAEIQRVLKPGGWVFAAVPFLQPYHGYPHHYYNMTREGLRNLFPKMTVESQFVPGSVHPIEALRWFVYDYCRGLPEKERARFEAMSIKDILQLPPTAMLKRNPPDFVRELDETTRFNLASGTYLIARK